MNLTPKKSEKKQHRCHGFKILDLGSKNSYLKNTKNYTLFKFKTFQIELLKNAQKHINTQTLVIDGDVLKTTAKGKFLCDGIASDLFFI